MKKLSLIFLVMLLLNSVTYSQIAVSKLIGKDSVDYNPGPSLFLFIEIPVGQANNAIRLEFDAAFHSDVKDYYQKGYGAYTLGYKYFLNDESKTGWYVVPSAGFTTVYFRDPYTGESKKNGVAVAFEGGYSLEVGQGGNAFNFGLKLGTHRAGKGHSLTALALRVGFSFGFFGGGR
jgi:hypothetical protein